MQNVSWKDVLHYGSAVGLIAVGLLGMSGVHIPGVSIDPAIAIGAGLGVFGAGLKSGVTSGVVKSLVLFAIVVMALAFSLPGAYAATPAPAKKLTAAQVQANPLSVLKQFSVADLKAALDDAQTNNDVVTAPCWQALLTAAQSQQTAAPALPAGLFSAIQKARDIKALAASALSPTGVLATLNVACAPLLMDANATLAAFGVATGVVVGTGGITLPALPGFLPLLLAVPK